MVFSSIIFLFYFLPLTLLFYYFVPFKYKNIVLLAASLIFYAWGEPSYVLLMLFSITANYFFGRFIGARESGTSRKVMFVSAVALNLGMLLVFKYTGFILQSVNAFLGTGIPVPDIVLPIGISFFTFQIFSYVIDVYRKKTDKQDNILHLALYISAFPQLIAGPIVRYTDVNEQILHRDITREKIAKGIIRFTIGLSKKVLIANSMAAIADAVFGTSGFAFSVATAWLGILAYTFQIYFDFSGYSDMAIGLGYMLGFEFLENFDHPYISRSVTEFWRRWHMSLSSWFRDYLYIPLGGNRRGLAIQVRNILIVWMATGIWHGANWTFVAWGLFWGVLLIIEKFIPFLREKLPRVFGHLYTLAFILIGWVFFRADSLSSAVLYLKRLLGVGTTSLFDQTARLYLHDTLFLFAIAAIAVTALPEKLMKRTRIYKTQSTAYFVLSLTFVLVLFSLCTVYLVNSVYNPFIYFRF